MVAACGEPLQPPTAIVSLSTGEGVSGAALALHLPFDETSGTVAADASGLGHTAILKKLAVFDPGGLFEGALRLNGSGAYVLLSDSPALNKSVLTQRTVALWFRADDVAITSRKQILYLEGDGNNGLGVYLHAGRLYVSAWNTNTPISWKGTYLWTSAIASRTYHHVTLVLNGGSALAPNALFGYLDGVRFSSGSAAQLGVRTTVTVGANDESVRFHDGKVSGSNVFGGRIDELRVYSRVLAETEIGDLAVRGPNRAPVTQVGADVTVTPGTTVVLDGSESADSDDSPFPLTYLWEQVAGAPVSIDNPTSPVASVTVPSSDTYVFRLTASDGELQSSDEMTVVAVNRNPVAVAGRDSWAYVGAPVQLEGAGSSDPDGFPAPLSFVWEQVSGAPVAIINPTSQTASVVVDGIGTSIFRLTVSDGELEAADEVSVTGRAYRPGMANPVPSSTLAGFRYGEWDGKNQRRSWWNSYRNRWDAVVPTDLPPASGLSEWWLVNGVDALAPRYATPIVPAGTSLTNPYTLDTYWDDAARMLYVLAAHRSTSLVKTYSYDPGTDTYRLVVNGVKVSGAGGFGTIYKTPNGHLWTSTMGTGSSNGLWINRSRDGGATWDGPVALLMPNASGQTSLTHFTRDGVTSVAVAGAEDGRAEISVFRFLHIDQNSLAWNIPSAWTDESSVMPSPQGAEHADDEISVIRDSDDNIYIAAESELGNYGDPQLFLYKRTPAGQWTQVTIRTRQSGVRYRKRPTIAIDGSSQTLYVFSLNLDKIELSYVSAPLANLGSLAGAPMTVVFQEPGQAYRNNYTPRFPTTTQSGLLVLIDNLIDGTIWARRLP
jgi:hypothetical protein